MMLADAQISALCTMLGLSRERPRPIHEELDRITDAVRQLLQKPQGSKRPVAFRVLLGDGGGVFLTDNEAAANQVAEALQRDYQGLFVRLTGP